MPASHHWEHAGTADSVPRKKPNSRVELCPFGPVPWWWRTLRPSFDSSDTQPPFCSSGPKHIMHSGGSYQLHLLRVTLQCSVFSTYLFVGADARWTAEVELRSIECECLTGAWVAVAVESAAFAAVHGELPHLSPRYETSVATESVQTALMGDLMLDRLWGNHLKKTRFRK